MEGRRRRCVSASSRQIRLAQSRYRGRPRLYRETGPCTVGVTVHVDIPVDIILNAVQTDMVSYAVDVVASLTDVFRNRTSDLDYWKGFDTPAEMATATGMSLDKAEAVYAQINTPMIGDSKTEFVCRSVVCDSKQTQVYPVSPYDSDSVDEMKLVRRPSLDDGTLDIWVTYIHDDVLGFANLPFTGTPRGVYGAVVDYRTTHYAFGYAPYDLNRTLAHEVGHCFGLLHVFRDPDTPLPAPGVVGEDPDDYKGDGAPDTPPQDNPTTGNPLVPGVDVDTDTAFVNHMDYLWDKAMLGFTADQVERMRFFMSDSGYLTDVVGQYVGPGGPGPVLIDVHRTFTRTTGEECDSDRVAWMATAIVFIVVTVGLGIGLAWALTRGKRSGQVITK